MNSRKLSSLLGFAQRSGRLASGQEAVETSMRRGRAKLLILAADAAPNTKSKLTNMAERWATPVYTCADKETLGVWVGRPRRAAVVVTDAGFAASIIRELGGPAP